MHDFTRLRVWQRAQKLILEIYADSELIDDAIYPGMAGQMRRAASSISARIADASTQPTPALLAKSLLQSIAFCTELLSHTDMARKFRLIEDPRHVILSLEIQEIRRMLYALRAKVLEKASSTQAVAERKK